MEMFQLHPESVSSLACGTLCLVVASYLISLPQKSRDARRLIIYFLLLMAIHGSGFLAQTANPASQLHVYALRVDVSLVILQLPFSLWYVYGYREDFAPREMRWVVGCCALLMLLAHAGAPRPFAWFSPLGLFFGLWKLIVLVRKAVRAGRPDTPAADRPLLAIWRELRRPTTRESEAQRALAFWSITTIILALNAVLADAGVNYPHAYWTVVHYGLVLTQMIWLLITYLDYASEPTTFLAKLVILFLCLTLFLLGILGSLLYQEKSAFDSATVLNQPGLRLLAGLIVLATGFILIGVPFFLRHHLLLPLRQVLEGVAQVNAGNLTSTVPVFGQDELGFLAQSFNQMTNSLRVYATQMEDLVARRTAELQHQKEVLQGTLQELRTTQAQLVQREKLASLGELTAGIAHEIQNPLNFVNNFSEVSTELVEELEEERARPARDAALETELLGGLKQNLVKITTHGRRAAGIVRGMLEHSRPSTGARASTDLNQLADEYLRLAYQSLRAKDKTFNAALQTDFAPGLPLVEAAGADLGRVLLNLFSNAFYAVQQRQQTGELGYAPTVRVSTHCENGQVILRVTDNGTGMPAEVQAKIFQPFFTTKPAGEGTGLGLSLSHNIIAQGHGGTLRVESQEGQGTTFCVALPLNGMTY
jgi:signal transduction histidine kinase